VFKKKGFHPPYSTEYMETVFCQRVFILFGSYLLYCESMVFYVYVISCRAPLNVVQSDDWDCFCCLLWDPAHADCAVPQVTFYLFCYNIIAKSNAKHLAFACA
jgi:hypothetical protein